MVCVVFWLLFGGHRPVLLLGWSRSLAGGPTEEGALGSWALVSAWEPGPHTASALFRFEVILGASCGWNSFSYISGFHLGMR